MTPKISVIIANYNRSALLEKCLLSFIHQKSDIPFDWEIIIVDDWSTDDSRALIQAYVDEYPTHVRSIFQQNKWVNCARNVWLDHLSENSTYTIIFDNDDEVVPWYFDFCLKTWQLLQENGQYDNVFTLISFCKNEHWELIGNKSLLQWKKEQIFWYREFLSNYFSSREMMSMDKSSTYIKNKHFRFDEEQLIGESILWANIYKYYYASNASALLTDFVWRIFRLDHWPRTTRNVSRKRFENSALSNEKVLEIIEKDLLNFNLNSIYAEFLFRIGINYVIWWNKHRWLIFVKKSLKQRSSLLYFCVYIFWIISPRLLFMLFKVYIKNH